MSLHVGDGPELWAPLAKLVPPGTRPIGLESDRWLVVQDVSTDATRVIDTSTGHEITGVFPKVRSGRSFAGGRAVLWKEGGVSVIDLRTEAELYRCPDCDPNSCAFGEASSNGHAIHCLHEGIHESRREIIIIDDPSHARVTTCDGWERPSPDDTYVLSLPRERTFVGGCVANPFISWRALSRGETKQVSAPTEPAKNRLDVAFCGGGELFFTFAKMGSTPSTISMFRGKDGSLVSTTAGPEGTSLTSAVIRAEMDQSGRYLALFADRPNDLAETWLYRLDP